MQTCSQRSINIMPLWVPGPHWVYNHFFIFKFLLKLPPRYWRCSHPLSAFWLEDSMWATFIGSEPLKSGLNRTVSGDLLLNTLSLPLCNLIWAWIRRTASPWPRKKQETGVCAFSKGTSEFIFGANRTLQPVLKLMTKLEQSVGWMGCIFFFFFMLHPLLSKRTNLYTNLSYGTWYVVTKPALVAIALLKNSARTVLARVETQNGACVFYIFCNLRVRYCNQKLSKFHLI